MVEASFSTKQYEARGTKPTTLYQLGASQLAALATVSDELVCDVPRMVEVFRELLGTAAQRPVHDAPAYLSDVVDDHTPFEMSLAVGGAGPELRLLVETVRGDSSLASRWAAARALGLELRDRHGAELRRLDAIAELFEPHREHGQLALWYAVSFRPGQPPEWKAYLDLRARGLEHTRGLLEEALDRLGLATAYPRLLREAGRRDLLDELVYFSLDLADHERARVKVYFRHHRATADDLERAIGGASHTAPGEIRAFCTAMLGDGGPYLPRPLVSCWAYSGTSEPTGATLYAPIAYYVQDDAEARARVRSWMTEIGISSTGYDRALAAFARRPLEAGVGMHSYVSFKRDGRVPRVTTYLAPEAYRTFPPGSLARREISLPRRPTSPEQLIHRYETVERIPDHPLFRRLAREPAAIAPVWTILANNWVAVGDQFPRWLAGLVARVEHDGMRRVLAKQLDDELGGGDPANAHRALFQRMLADLEPYAVPGDREALFAPGRRFAEGLAYNYLERPWLEGVGGSLVAEVYGKQVDQVLGALLRRQRAADPTGDFAPRPTGRAGGVLIPPPASLDPTGDFAPRPLASLDPSQLTWLVLHETLEEEHAGEAVELARMTPPTHEARAAVCRGAEALAALGMRYFDDLYEVVFR